MKRIFLIFLTTLSVFVSYAAEPCDSTATTPGSTPAVTSTDDLSTMDKIDMLSDELLNAGVGANFFEEEVDEVLFHTNNFLSDPTFIGGGGPFNMILTSCMILAALFAIIYGSGMAYKMMYKGEPFDPLKILKVIAVAIIMSTWYSPGGILDTLAVIPNSLGSWTKTLYDIEAEHVQKKFDELTPLLVKRDHMVKEKEGNASAADDRLNKGSKDTMLSANKEVEGGQKAAKKKAKQKRSSERSKEKIAALKEAAKTDPEAAAEYEAYLEKRRENGKKYREAYKAKQEADPAYQAEQAEKAARKAAREKLAYLRRIKIAELEELAKTDPEAAEVLQTRREKAAIKNQKAKAQREARLASDPEYAAQQAEKARKRSEIVKERRAALKEQAKTDPEAAAKYEAMRARERENANRYNAAKRARAAVDPEYAAERDAQLAERYKKEYARQKGIMDDLKARADCDPEAAAKVEAERAAVSAKNRRYRENLKEQAKTDPVAAQKIIDRRIRKRELERKAAAEAKAAKAGKELVDASA